jgi:hypothetical protein
MDERWKIILKAFSSLENKNIDKMNPQNRFFSFVSLTYFFLQIN